MTCLKADISKAVDGSDSNCGVNTLLLLCHDKGWWRRNACRLDLHLKDRLNREDVFFELFEQTRITKDTGSRVMGSVDHLNDSNQGLTDKQSIPR